MRPAQTPETPQEPQFSYVLDAEEGTLIETFRKLPSGWRHHVMVASFSILSAANKCSALDSLSQSKGVLS